MFDASALADSTDPGRLWRAGPHGKALPSLRHAVGRGKQLALLTGDPGVGKTIGINMLAQQLADDGMTVARIPVPVRDAVDLRAAIGFGLGGAIITTREGLVEAASHRGRLAIVIDDADALGDAALAELGDILHALPGSVAVLSGPDALAARIAGTAVGSLASILPVARRLRPLGESEASLYVEHMLEQAGARPDAIPDETVRAIWRTSGGVPRMILHLCRRVLENGRQAERGQLKLWAQEMDTTVADAPPDREPPEVVVLPEPSAPRARPSWRAAVAAMLILAGAIAAVIAWLGVRQARAPEAARQPAISRQPQEAQAPSPPPAPAPEQKPAEVQTSIAPAGEPASGQTPPPPGPVNGRVGERVGPTVEPVPKPASPPAAPAPTTPPAARTPALPPAARTAEAPRPARRQPPAPQPQSSPATPTEPPARPAEPARAPESARATDSASDPGAVIDWLLKDSPRSRD